MVNASANTIENGVNVTVQEISILARELRAASFGALTQREAINQARALVFANGGK